MSSYEIRQGDVLDRLREMPSELVHCVVTSPPYFGLRSYGVEGQMGLEATPEIFVGKMVEVFREVRRVLRSDGQLWLNLGDSYAGGAGGRGDIGNIINGSSTRTQPVGDMRLHNPVPQGLKAKDLMMIPARLALALQADGWWIRSEITWCKRAPMPESVRDRPTSATEKIYLLTKSSTYYFDSDAVRVKAIEGTDLGLLRGKTFSDDPGVSWHAKSIRDRQAAGVDSRTAGSGTRNMWNYWLLSPDPYAEAHFATFPREIPRRAILAGTSERGVCGACGAPHRRVVERGELVPDNPDDVNGTMGGRYAEDLAGFSNRTNDIKPRHHYEQIHKGWQPTCPCDAPTVPATVLDCFSGAGTTGLVAVQLGRRYIGLELNQEYIDMSLKRIHREGAPLFAWADGQTQEDLTPQAVSK